MRLIAVAGERLGSEEFLEKYWRSEQGPLELYIDEGKKQLWPIMGSGSQGWSGLASYIFGGSVKKNIKRLKERALAAGRASMVPGNLQGTQSTKLGGLWVVGTGEQGILMEHQERTFADVAELDAVRQAVAAIAAPRRPSGWSPTAETLTNADAQAYRFGAPDSKEEC